MRLIDADALKKDVGKLWEQMDDVDFGELVRDFWKVLNHYPTIDAVPVVRCKDCEYRGGHDLCPMCVRVYQLDESGYLDCTVDDGFCHCGWKMDAKEDAHV